MIVPITVNIEVQCHPKSQRIPFIRKPIQAICLALLEHGGLKPYEIQQALESLSSFWAAISNHSKKLEDYKDIFGEE